MLNIIKVGGAVVEDRAALANLISQVGRLSEPRILVHGGGRSATALAKQLDIPTTMIDGRRVTDAEMLRVVTMVYGGLVNKQIVAGLQHDGIDAIGLTGADARIISAHRRPVTAEGVDYGYVGDVDAVDGAALKRFIDAGLMPVVAPLSYDTADGTLLNTNADTIAGAVAGAMAGVWPEGVRLVFCFEKAGVLADADDDSSVIPEINRATYDRLRDQGIVGGGMLPKLDNAFKALHSGVAEVIITKADAVGDLSLGSHIRL